MEGFIAFEYQQEFPRALSRLAQWYKDGRLKLRSEVVHGLERFTGCLGRLFAGENTGKLVLKLSEGD